MNILIFAMFLDLSGYGNLAHLNHRFLNTGTGRFVSQDYEKQFSGEYSYGDGRIMLSADYTGDMLWVDEFEKDTVQLIQKRPELSAHEDTVEATTHDPHIHDNIMETVIFPIQSVTALESGIIQISAMKTGLSNREKMDAYAKMADLPENYHEIRSKKRRKPPMPLPRTLKLLDELPPQLYPRIHEEEIDFPRRHEMPAHRLESRRVTIKATPAMRAARHRLLESVRLNNPGSMVMPPVLPKRCEGCPGY